MKAIAVAPATASKCKTHAAVTIRFGFVARCPTKMEIDTQGALVFADHTVSGASDDRPELKDLLAKIERGPISVLADDDRRDPLGGLGV